VSPALLRSTGPPLVATMVWMAVVSLLAFRGAARGPKERVQPEAPSELGAAVAFGALYAVVLLAVAVAKEKFGNRALFLVAALSGATDMDAITLSTAQLVNADRLEAPTGWRLILVGALANLVFKGGVAAVLGSAQLRRRVAALFALAIAGGGLVLWLWPS
jgi:uncharacterized membrane protein (DUF4010 family)